MIGNRLEQEIIGLYNRDLTLVLSINQIAKNLKKAYPHIHTRVKELISQGILKKVQVGRSTLCMINLDDDKAIVLLMLNETIKKDKFFRTIKNAQALSREVKDLTKEFRIYAIFSVRSSIYIVLDHIHDQEAIKNKYLAIKALHPAFYTKEAFLKETLENKSLLSDKTIIYGGQTYFELVYGIIDQLIARHTFTG